MRAIHLFLVNKIVSIINQERPLELNLKTLICTKPANVRLCLVETFSGEIRKCAE